MIATHNIKVNGRWYKAGEEYEAEQPRQEEPAAEIPVTEVPAEEPAQKEPEPAPKARTSARRKNTTSK